MAHIKNQLRTLSGDVANQHPLDFLPPIAFMWSKKGVESSIAFTGMADPAEFEFKNPQNPHLEEDAPVEPSMLQGKSISLLADRGVRGRDSHWQSVASLGISEVLSQTRMQIQYQQPIQKYPFLASLVHAAAAAANSSKGVETNWGVLSMFANTRTNLSFGSLREQYTNQNGMTMGLDWQAIEEDDLQFRLGLEIARLPGWRKFDGADTLLREAMHADYKHAETVRKARRSCGTSTLDESYRGERWLNLTASEKTSVLNKTLRICAINGFECDASKVAALRQKLGLPVASARLPRSRARKKGLQAERCLSPPPVPHHALTPPPSPPPQQLQLQQPPASAPPMPALPPSPLPNLSDCCKDSLGDGHGMSTSADGDENDESEDGVLRADTRGGVGGAATAARSEDDEDESEESEIEFADNELDPNTHSIAFVYDTFNACTPNHPKDSDNIWLPSLVNFREYQGVKSVAVTRRPSDHLRRLLGTFEQIPTATMQFTVYKHCKFLRYILRQSWSGCVIVKVETFSPPEDDNWSKTARIRRVMTTEHAIKECQVCTDAGVHIGKSDLQKFQDSLDSYQRDKRPWTVGSQVYHESDVLEDADIRELIGVARWYPFSNDEAPESNHFKSPYDYTTADLIFIGAPFRQTIKTARKGRATPAGGPGRAPRGGGGGRAATKAVRAGPTSVDSTEDSDDDRPLICRKGIVEQPELNAGGAVGQGAKAVGPFRGRATPAGGRTRRGGGAVRAGSKPVTSMEDSDDDDSLFGPAGCSRQKRPGVDK